MSLHAIYPDLRNKVILLTGIGQVGDPAMWGNGAATARAFARNGAKIFGCDLRIDAAKATQKRLLSEFPQAEVEVTQADITKREEVKKLVEGCLKKFGRIDVLVNNVGRSEKGDPATMSEEVWNEQIDVNLKSVYLTCHFVLPVMEGQGSGVVANNASIGQSSQPFQLFLFPVLMSDVSADDHAAGLKYIGKPQVAYSATKAALINFTRVTAVAYAPKGIRLNTVVPGLIHTPLVKMLADKYANGNYEGFVKQRNGQVFYTFR